MIHYFNPGHEVAVNNGSKYYNAPSNVLLMQQQLSFLPAWYAKPSDIVFVYTDIDKSYYKYLKENLPQIPKTATLNQLSDYRNSEVVLWGISPQTIHYFDELNKELDLDLKLPEWSDLYLTANGRKNSKACLEELVNNIPSLDNAIIPRVYTDINEIISLVESTPYPLLVKSPYSSSGKGLLWLDRGEVGQSQRQILQGMLKKQQYVTLEKALNKQTDFVMEFYSDGENINFIGYSIFKTDNKGAYKGSYLTSQNEIINQLTENIEISLLNEVKLQLERIFTEKYLKFYKGYLGVDMFIYKNENEYKLQACVEINMRSNMALLAIKISENYICKNTNAWFYIDFGTKTEEVFNRHSEMEEQYPAKFENGKLLSGYLPLCPVIPESNYWAYIITE